MKRADSPARLCSTLAGGGGEGVAPSLQGDPTDGTRLGAISEFGTFVQRILCALNQQESKQIDPDQPGAPTRTRGVGAVAA